MKGTTLSNGTHVTAAHNNTREVRGVSQGKSVVVLVSYNTPVAVQYDGGQAYHTQVKYSVTTSKHIRQWLAGRQNGGAVSQADIDAALVDLTGWTSLP